MSNERRDEEGAVRNKLLRTLNPRDFDQLRAVLEIVELKRNAVIGDVNKPVEAVYFIETGLISTLARTHSDGPIECALVGRRGFVGLSVVLGETVATHRSVVQIGGTAFRASARDFVAVLVDAPSIREHLLRYAQPLLMQMAQVCLCNAKHGIESRLARWLLVALDNVDASELPVTHESLALTLGVRRAGITEAVGRLEAAGIVRQRRGAIEVLNVSLLRDESCECYDIIRGRQARYGPAEHSHRFDTPRPDNRQL